MTDMEIAAALAEWKPQIRAWRTESRPGKARDTMRKLVATWAEHQIPVDTPRRASIADDIACTVMAGLAPYMDAVITEEAVSLARALLSDGRQAS